MMTALTIILVVLIVLNVWYTIGAVKFQKDAKIKLQERMDEFDEEIGELTNEAGVMKQRYNEQLQTIARIKKMLEEKDATLKRLHSEIEKRDKRIEELEKQLWPLGEPNAAHQDPVNGGEPSVHTEPGDPADKPSTVVPKDKKPAKKAKRVYPKKSNQK